MWRLRSRRGAWGVSPQYLLSLSPGWWSADPFDFAQDRPQGEAHQPCSQEKMSRVEGVPLKLPRLRYASPCGGEGGI